MPGVRSDTVPPKLCPPYSRNSMRELYLGRARERPSNYYTSQCTLYGICTHGYMDGGHDCGGGHN